MKSVISKMAKFSDVELAMMAIILDEEEVEHKVKTRKWAHEVWKKKRSERESAALY